MNWFRISIYSLAANVVLLAIAAYIFSKPNRNRVEMPETTPVLITSTVTQLAVKKISASNFWATLMASRNPSWAMVESTNYVTYIENLRSMGCPEETVRDIIIADIAKMYAKKRAAVLVSVPPAPYWRSQEAWSATPERKAQLAALHGLEQEEQALVKTLLGVELAAELDKFSRSDEPPGDSLDYLPAEKRDQVLQIQQRFAELETQVNAAASGLLLESDLAQLERLRAEREKELGKILSPEEMEGYQLRNSNTAESLRAQLGSGDLNEEEFRRLFRLQQTFSEQMETQNPGEQARTRAQQALDEEIKKVLGDKRFAEYQRAQDAEYQNLARISERFQVSRESLEKVYEMKQVAQRQKQLVEANPNLSPEQRAAALQALANQTRSSVAQTLGGKDSSAWKAVEETAGWLQGLSDFEVPVAEPVIEAPPTAPRPPFGPPFGPPIMPPFPPVPNVR